MFVFCATKPKVAIGAWKPYISIKMVTGITILWVLNPLIYINNAMKETAKTGLVLNSKHGSAATLEPQLWDSFEHIAWSHRECPDSSQQHQWSALWLTTNQTDNMWSTVDCLARFVPFCCARCSVPDQGSGQAQSKTQQRTSPPDHSNNNHSDLSNVNAENILD